MQIRKIQRRQSADDFKLTMPSMMFVNALFWCLYGIGKCNLWLSVTYSISTLFGGLLLAKLVKTQKTEKTKKKVKIAIKLIIAKDMAINRLL
ncbi:MAG: hypothetical protein LBB45_02305 [Methanobrevibacter sp.]|jgi:uncharacterized protein with PQ loop repeat|nr:hypothetical protein [Candidatus Methanovirga basalitermitum]